MHTKDCLPAIEMRGPRLNQVGETEGEVTDGDDAVGADHFTRRFLHDGEHQLQLLLAELWATHTECIHFVFHVQHKTK